MVEPKLNTIVVTSSAFKQGETIPRKYTGQGADVSPPLSWGPVPEGTKSFALINDDPDAPVGNWVHWLVKNIPKDTTEFKEGSFVGEAVVKSWGNEKYGGPMPPKGTHRYFFKIYALDIENMKAKNAKDFYKEVETHKIAQGDLMGKYQKT